jgi:Mg/Co/Ni transporter MgtE
MHPADLSAVLRQLPTGLRNRVFQALSDEAAAAVLAESVAVLQKKLLACCPRPRRATLQRLQSVESKNSQSL